MNANHKIEEAQLAILAKISGLRLSQDRCLVLLPALSSVLELFDVIDTVEVGETPPASAFDPRWDGQS